MKGLVFGASGMVGAYIAEHLATAGDPVIPVSRRARGDGWITADLTQLETLRLPKADVVFSAANARTLAKALPRVLDCNPRRVVVISSTSVFSKLNTPDEDERGSILELIDAEKSIMETCGAADVEWTILRPTLIYKEGQDRNVTQISKLIRTLRFMPLYGEAQGLRQPVHAEDLARGAIAAARSSNAANKAYFTTGTDTIPYREMVGRIFDGMSLPRRMVSLRPLVWKSAFALAKPFFPGVTVAMGERMTKDLAFDSSTACAEFGWHSRKFAPSFG